MHQPVPFQFQLFFHYKKVEKTKSQEHSSVHQKYLNVKVYYFSCSFHFLVLFTETRKETLKNFLYVVVFMKRFGLPNSGGRPSHLHKNGCEDIRAFENAKCIYCKSFIADNKKKLVERKSGENGAGLALTKKKTQSIDLNFVMVRMLFFFGSDKKIFSFFFDSQIVVSAIQQKCHQWQTRIHSFSMCFPFARLICIRSWENWPDSRTA